MFDQFYTKRDRAKDCFSFFVETMRQEDRDINRMFFIEPSAGEGSFFDLLPLDRRMGMDTEPKHEAVMRGDFLSWNLGLNWSWNVSLNDRACYPRKDTVVIGNPPFGKRSRLAIEFFNCATLIADTIAFIVPVAFRKYRIHTLLHRDFCLIASYDLPRDSFYTEKQCNYEVNTEFQIWTSLPLKNIDMRLRTCPPINHSDFFLHQYNNTQEALKVFNNKFVFAVPAQGYQDYSRREKNSAECEKNKQWILF